MNTPTSLPPPSITWPMVAYAFVRELPYLAMTMGGAAVAIVMLAKGDGTTLEHLGAIIGPAVISALAKSRPIEPHAGALAVLGLVLRKKFGL